MKKILSLRLRKCTDINLELPFFEAVDDGGETILDISESADGERLVLFHKGCEGKILAVELLNQIIKDAYDLIDKEKS